MILLYLNFKGALILRARNFKGRALNTLRILFRKQPYNKNVFFGKNIANSFSCLEMIVALYFPG